MITPTDVEHVLAYQDPEHACNQGSIIKLSNGELLLGFNQERGLIHSDSGQSCFVRSSDGGRSWDASTFQVVWPWTEYGGNWDCAFTQTSDGAILMHTRVCSFIAPSALKDGADQTLLAPPPGKPERLKRQTGYAILRSDDLGATWGDAVPVNTAPIAAEGLMAYSVGGSGAGHIVELPDGGLLMPLHGSISREFQGREGETLRCFVLRSDDGGANWEYWSTVGYDPGHILGWAEQGLTRLANGTLISMMRTSVKPSRNDNMWLTHSEDDGASWAPPKRTALWGFPPDLIQLHDGRVLAVYGYRKEPDGVRGCVSEDGLTWDLENEFVIRSGGFADPSVAMYWHTGYPSVVQLEDGTIVCGYHEYVPNGAAAEPIQAMWTTRFRL